MKPILMLPVVALALGLTGCEFSTPSLLSLEPAVTDKDTAPDLPLAGAWESDSSACLIHKDKEKDNVFEIVFMTGESRLTFEGGLFRAGDAWILDLKPEGDGDDFRVPGHAFARVWVDGSVLRWAFLDSDWLKEQLKTLPGYATGKKTLLLATGAAVRAFIEKLGADDRAYTDQGTLQRM